MSHLPLYVKWETARQQVTFQRWYPDMAPRELKRHQAMQREIAAKYLQVEFEE
jgi:hypothetical protein